MSTIVGAVSKPCGGRRRTPLMAGLFVLMLTAGGCGGGSAPTSATTTQFPAATCGPSTYSSVLVVPDNGAQSAPLVSAGSPPRCDQVLESAFKLVFGPAKYDYSQFLFREKFVPGTSVLDCLGQVTHLPDNPNVSAAVTPPSLGPDGWVDLNGLNLTTTDLDHLLPSGCSLRSTVLDQWLFRATTTPDIPAAQAACGGGFDNDGWKTFATKVNFQSRTGSVVRSCKTIDGGPVGNCIDFDTAPKLALPPLVIMPAAGGTLKLQPRIIVATPAAYTCRLWSATSDASYIRVTNQLVRKDVAASSEIELVVDPNLGPLRTGNVVARFADTAEQAVTQIQQDAAGQPAICPLLAISGPLDWLFNAADKFSCEGSFANLDWGKGQPGVWRITQTGCTVRLVRPDTFPEVVANLGTIEGNVLKFSIGPVSSIGSPITFTESTEEFVGIINSKANPPGVPIGQSIDVTTRGHFAGTFQGVPGSCDRTGVQVWSWRTPLPPLPPH